MNCLASEGAERPQKQSLFRQGPLYRRRSLEEEKGVDKERRKKKGGYNFPHPAQGAKGYNTQQQKKGSSRKEGKNLSKKKCSLRRSGEKSWELAKCSLLAREGIF